MKKFKCCPLFQLLSEGIEKERGWVLEKEREKKNIERGRGREAEAVIKDFRIKTENIFSIIGTTGAFICIFVKGLS